MRILATSPLRWTMTSKWKRRLRGELDWRGSRFPLALNRISFWIWRTTFPSLLPEESCTLIQSKEESQLAASGARGDSY